MELKGLARRGAGEAGFSMIEALIAAAVLLILAVGMIPLFARAMINNALGNDYTQATAHGLTGLEKPEKLPMTNIDISGTRVQYVEKGLQTGSPVADLDWKYTPTDPDRVVWTRTTQQRYYSVTALDDGQLTTDELIPAGSAVSFWNIMEVTTLLDSGKTNPGSRNSGGLAAIRQTNFQYLKAF
ncbi:MAG TPA: hypothetical protein VH988_10440 [Thermoanaerobaculia bacterium]|nr:hypothetical protein [Thermoanaerobaculia bacterium]